MGQPIDAHSAGVDDLDETAARILEAALGVLTCSGIRGATTRAIATAAGVNEVTLFRRFGTKAELLRTAISHRLEEAMGASAEFTGDLESDLIRLADVYRSGLEAFGPLARIIMSEVAHVADLEPAVETARRFYREVGELFQRYHEIGELEPEPVWWTVSSFLGPLAIPFIIEETAPRDPDAAFNPGVYVQRFLDGRRASA